LLRGGEHLLQKDILRYLVQHTEAKDTVQGVFHWWLPPTYIGLGEAELTSALDDLVAKGWLTMSSHARDVKLYGIEISRLDEILRWLEN
jgi:hypothetical protein